MLRKGITPVISLIMLMLITVGIVGIAYAWFSGLTNATTEDAVSIPPGGAYCYKLGGNNYIAVMVQNNGAQSTIMPADIIVATINGIDCTSTLYPAGLGVPTYFPSAGIAPGKAATVFAGRGNAALCANGTTYSQGTYQVIVGTKTNLAQTQVICK
ncbi:MAG: hypothetical protein V1836_01365 [Candidatus Aenigmatarchaeota archaeon]